MRTFLQRGCMYAVPQFQKSFPFDQKQQASPKPHLIFEHFCSFYIFLVNKLQNMLSKRQKKASISKSFLNLQKLISTSYCQCKKVNIKVTNQKVWFWYISKVVVVYVPLVDEASWVLKTPPTVPWWRSIKSTKLCPLVTCNAALTWGGGFKLDTPLFWSTIDLEYKRVPQSKLAL